MSFYRLLSNKNIIVIINIVMILMGVLYAYHKHLGDKNINNFKFIFICVLKYFSKIVNESSYPWGKCGGSEKLNDLQSSVT